MKLRKIHITNTAKVLASMVIVAVVIGFTERKSADNVCTDIVIRIENQHDNYFINEHDILSMMTADGNEAIIGNSYEELNLKAIEERVAAEPFIKEVQIYRDLKGYMVVHANLRRPYARVISGNKSMYIAMDGTFLPVTRKYNTRSIVLTGSYFKGIEDKNLNDSDKGKELFQMLNFIYNDKFWKAQIAQITIDKKMKIVIYPQITKQVIEFGDPENYKEKFKKLKIFYNDILPRKGWNYYERVNLEYKDQIIAE